LYGSAQIVPYTGKDINNFRSTIRRTEKFKDMQEAVTVSEIYSRKILTSSAQ
jgi:hypothetical protein